MISMYEKIYLEITDALVDTGFIVIENALDSKIYEKLLASIKDEGSFKKAGITRKSDLEIRKSSRSDKTKWLDEDNISQSEYLGFTTGLQVYLNRSLYLGLNSYESHFSIYEKGDCYEKHFDSLRGSKNRVVTTVYYLNKDFESKDGGQLVIYDENSIEIKRVIPNANTLVVFMSEDFLHEVLPAITKRNSIAGWFRVGDRLI